jgi:uncharacterized protein YchJ
MPSGLQQHAQVVGMNVFRFRQLLSSGSKPQLCCGNWHHPSATEAANNAALRGRPCAHLVLTSAEALLKQTLCPAGPLILL